MFSLSNVSSKSCFWNYSPIITKLTFKTIIGLEFSNNIAGSNFVVTLNVCIKLLDLVTKSWIVVMSAKLQGFFDINKIAIAEYTRWNVLYIELCGYNREKNYFETSQDWRLILRISSYSVQMQGNTDQRNSEYGHFSRSVKFEDLRIIRKYGKLLKIGEDRA